MRLSYEAVYDLLHSLLEEQVDVEPDSGPNTVRKASGRSLIWSDQNGSHHITLPLLMPAWGETESLSRYLELVPELPPNHVVVLLRAGSASLGYYLGHELEAHKVIRKYMVRKSQGRMQIAYLNQKGKSRAGSRVRLRESVEFFEEINEKLQTWFTEIGEPELIFHSCPVRLWSHWISSEVSAPFSADDTRLIHLPFHVHQPDHDELMRVHRLLSTGIVK